MATSSLSNMTVPLASDQSSPSQGLLMPKLKYRFRVTFQNFGVSSPVTELTKQVVDFKRPDVDFEDIIVPIYNSTLKLAGKYTWAAVTCNLRDDAAGTVSKLVGEQIQKQFDFMEQSSASSGIDYKFTTVLEILDGGNGTYTPITLETWNLYGCYLKSVSYGDVSYSESNPIQIALTINFDNALQTPIGSGIGATVGRTLGDVITGVGTTPAAV
jgi:hypothetical protein